MTSLNWPQLLQTISLGQWEWISLSRFVFAGNFLVKDVFAKSQQREQRELLWGAAEAWRSEQRSSDRHLSFLHFTSSRCPCTQPTQPAVSGGHMCVSVCIPVYVCVCACVCPGPRYAALIKPTAKRKTRPAASCNDPEYTYGCFGENKWAENGIHKHSWYREGRGGETLNSSRAAASQTIPLSHEEGRFFFPFYRFLASVSVSAVVYLQRMCVLLPAKHLRIVVDGDVGCDAVVVRAKVAVRSTKPLIKAVLQRKVLWPVAQMPAVTNKQHTHTHTHTVRLTSLKDDAAALYLHTCTHPCVIQTLEHTYLDFWLLLTHLGCHWFPFISVQYVIQNSQVTYHCKHQVICSIREISSDNASPITEVQPSKN